MGSLGSKIRLALALGAVSTAFGGGWQIATWRLESQQARDIARREQAYRDTIAEIAANIVADQQRTAQQEGALLAELADSRDETEVLRREITERPIVTATVEVPVAGECPAVPRIDWGVFVELYNRAATGAPAAGAPDSGDAIVPGGAADTAE